jgi:hypothetical protein
MAPCALAGVLALALGAPAQAAPQDAPDVLTRDSYFRRYYEFGLLRLSSDALKEEGETLLRPRGLKRVERETRRHLRHRDIDWKTTDWRDVAVVHFRRTQLGDDTRAVEMIPVIPPSDDWTQPGFDDAFWRKQRLGRLPARRHMKEAFEFSSLLIRSACFRTYFDVPDPGRAGDLILDLTYRGGARVFVNGTQVAAGHLVAGKPYAEDYPREAYISLPDEAPSRQSGILGEIRRPFEQAPPARKKEWAGYRSTTSRQPLNRKGWTRLMRLRDRTLHGVRIPARLLRKGSNVLAVEVRGARFHPQVLPGAGHPKASNWGRHGGTENFTWDHARLLDVRLRGGGGMVPSGAERPAGVQVWAEDMHTRLFDRDFHPAGWPRGVVRMVGVPNGSFSGMLAVGTNRELTGLRAQVGRLTGPKGALPAAATHVRYLKGHPILELHKLGHDRCLGLHHWNCPMALAAVARYRVYLDKEYKDSRARREAHHRLLSGFRFFDHVAAAAPERVPAGSCQPIWVRIEVPPNAEPGRYRGAVRVTAEGMEPQTVPVELEVIGWRLPEPARFQTLVESEQSPYGVAKAYKLKPWSDEHWAKMEVSFRQLARLGADWLFVPVLLHSEFGNRDDASFIRWIRGKDGRLRFDPAVLDRYLDLAIKHWGKPRVICFCIMHGVSSATNHVLILDEATGKTEQVDVGPRTKIDRRPLWRAFAVWLRQHMRRRGLEDAMYWGHAFDRVYDPGLIKMMAEFTPGIYWAAGAHARKPDATFRAVARTYGSDMTDHSLHGWKNPFIHLLMPRTNGSVICVEGTSTPFPYRVMTPRAIYGGFNGIGRMGADYFDKTWWDGFRGGEYLLVGRSCVQTLWPGPDGAESSTRNEAMLEGIQEAEARIFLEQALERGLLPEELARETQQVLDAHFRETLHIPGGTAAVTMMEYTGDWRGRSRRLFAAAARVARHVGLDVDRTQIGAEQAEAVFGGRTRKLRTRNGVPLPAAGRAEVELTLRNWTDRPRAWTAAVSDPWIQPARMKGTLEGHEALRVVLDGTDLGAGQTVIGTLTLTDVPSGRTIPVTLRASVEPPMELVVKRTVFNITVGEAASQDYLLTNRTQAEQAWRLASSVPWMRSEPDSGTLEPGATAFVKLRVAPPDRAAACHRTTLTLTAMNGRVKDTFRLKTFVIPPYRKPETLPPGRAVPLHKVSKDLLVRHRSIGWFRNDRVYKRPTFTKSLSVWHRDRPAQIGTKTYDVALWIKPAHETVYKLTGTDYTGFSAEVGWNAMVTKSRLGRGWQTVRLSFEVHVDGRVVAQSGLMRADAPPRLLVARNLGGAKELKLVTRTQYDADEPLGLAYGNWGAPKLYRPD